MEIGGVPPAAFPADVPVQSVPRGFHGCGEVLHELWGLLCGVRPERC